MAAQSHIHAHPIRIVMPQMPAVQFQEERFVAIHRTDQESTMKVYHTNSACSTYQRYESELPAVGYPFAGDPVECIFCQRLTERGE